MNKDYLAIPVLWLIACIASVILAATGHGLLTIFAPFLIALVVQVFVVAAIAAAIVWACLGAFSAVF